MLTINLNKEFRFTYQPKVPDEKGRRRFSVGAGSLFKYIGKKNSETVFEKALEKGLDKFRVRFRKHGLIDIYTRHD